MAFLLNGKQIRYLKISIDATKLLQSIELVEGDNRSTPLVFAITVESAGGKVSLVERRLKRRAVSVGLMQLA